MAKNSIPRKIKALQLNYFRGQDFPTKARLLIYSAILGVIGGIGAFIFYTGLEWTQNLILTQFTGFNTPGEITQKQLASYLFFLVPALGGLVAGYLVYKLAPEAEGHGIDSVIEAFHDKKTIRTRVPFVKALASIVTIGSGGSAGYEGPTAQIGAGLGAIFSRLLEIPEKMGRFLLLAGTAAGLGAIFRAPLGGALTAIEVIYKEDFESEAILPCIVASVVGFATFTQIVQNTDPLFHVPGITFTNPSELLFFGFLGIVCIPFSWAFVSFYFKINQIFTSLKLPKPVKPALGGLLVGIIAYICPQAIGGSWEALHQAVNAEFAIHTLLFIGAFKIITTGLTVGSGGSGGVFGPALFIGGMIGGAFGFSMEYFFPDMVTNPSAYVLVGMGAFFAGVANAPLASIIMVCEVTGNYHLLAPMMLSSIIHFMFARKWNIFKNQRTNKFSSPIHREELHMDVLQDAQVKSILSQNINSQMIQGNLSLEGVKKIVQSYPSEVYLVLQENGSYMGLFSKRVFQNIIMENQWAPLNQIYVKDYLTPLHILDPELSLKRALQEFIKSGLPELPVVDSSEQFLGNLRYQDILAAYEKLVQQ